MVFFNFKKIRFGKERPRLLNLNLFLESCDNEDGPPRPILYIYSIIYVSTKFPWWAIGHRDADIDY